MRVTEMLLVSKDQLDRICKDREEKQDSSFLDGLSKDIKEQVKGLESKGLRFSHSTGVLVGCEDQIIEGTSVLDLIPKDKGGAPQQEPNKEGGPDQGEQPAQEEEQQVQEQDNPAQEATQQDPQQGLEQESPSVESSPAKRKKGKITSAFPSWRRAYDLKRTKAKKSYRKK